MNPYNFCLLWFGFCSLLVGIFIWLKRQDSIGSHYLALSICYLAWAVIIAISLSDNISYGVGLYSARIANCFAAFIPVLWFHFCLVFTNRLKKHKLWLYFLYLNPVIISSFAATKWFIPFVRPMLDFKYYSFPGPVYYVKTLSYFVIVSLGFWLLLKRTRETEGAEREQVRGLFWASLIGYLGGSLTFFPIYGIPLPQYGMFLMPIYPFAMAYFLMRKGLFDVEALVQAAHRDKLTAIGVLAASINHEVQNPLFIIKGLAETWLERKQMGVFKNDKQGLEKGEEVLQRSVEQADRAMDIIKRLSLFAKAGIDGEMKFEEVSIAEVVEDVLPLVRYELAAHNIALVREIPQNLPEVHADRRYLEEILFNLIVNAIQALKDTGKPGEIRIKAEIASPSARLAMTYPSVIARSPAGATRQSPAEQVIITIQDNGPGIPAEKLKDVFRPFYTTKAEGTGLGLYITQQLVEKIKGRIDVQSKVGMGTTFSVTLKTS